MVEINEEKTFYIYQNLEDMRKRPETTMADVFSEAMDQARYELEIDTEVWVDYYRENRFWENHRVEVQLMNSTLEYNGISTDCMFEFVAKIVRR